MPPTFKNKTKKKFQWNKKIAHFKYWWISPLSFRTLAFLELSECQIKFYLFNLCEELDFYIIVIMYLNHFVFIVKQVKNLNEKYKAFYYFKFGDKSWIHLMYFYCLRAVCFSDPTCLPWGTRVQFACEPDLHL